MFLQMFPERRLGESGWRRDSLTQMYLTASLRSFKFVFEFGRANLFLDCSWMKCIQRLLYIESCACFLPFKTKSSSRTPGTDSHSFQSGSYNYTGLKWYATELEAGSKYWDAFYSNYYPPSLIWCPGAISPHSLGHMNPWMGSARTGTVNVPFMSCGCV